MGTPHDVMAAILQTLAAVGIGIALYCIADVLWALAFNDDNPEPIDGTGLPEPGCCWQPQHKED